MNRLLTGLLVFSAILMVSMVVAFPLSQEARIDLALSSENQTGDEPAGSAADTRGVFLPPSAVAPILLFSTGILGLVGISRKKD